MKTFIDHILLYEDKSRFIKRNKNLNRHQKQEVLDFFAEYEQAVKNNHRTKVDWNKSGDLTYEDFQKIMSTIKSSPSFLKSKARKLRHKGVSGLKEGEDYVYVKTNNKSFLCYIPLNYKANQVIFSSNIGGMRHDGCIGSSSAKQYYRSEAVKKGLVPVVVVGASKDTVMIKRDNKQWELWDCKNNRESNGSRPFVNKELIPDFSIKKELITNKLAGLYDWVRSEIWGGSTGGKYSEEEYDDAVTAYEDLAGAIEQYVSDHDEAEEYGRNEVIRIIGETADAYREKAEKAEEEARDVVGDSSQFRKLKDRVDSFRGIMRAEPQGTGTDAKTGEPIWHIRGTEPSKKRLKSQYFKFDYMTREPSEVNREGIPYTRKELQAFIDLYDKDYSDVEIVEPDFSERDELLGIADKLDALGNSGDWYEVYDDNRGSDYEWLDEVEFSEYIPSEEYSWTEDVHSPYIQSDTYAPYFDFNQQHGNGEDVGDEYHLDESIREEVYSGGNTDGADLLSDSGYEHPEKIVENMTANEDDD